MEEQELIQDCIAARPKAQKALFDIYAQALRRVFALHERPNARTRRLARCLR